MFAAASAFAANEEVVTVPTREGVSVSYLLVREPSASPKVVAVTFIGGNGVINLAKRAASGPVKFGPAVNFLIRAREQFVTADIAEAIVDAPSDQLPDGMRDEFRLGVQHAADIRAVMSSTVTNRDRAGPGLSAFDFETIRVPVLLVHHRQDACGSSPYAGAARLAKSYPVISVSGGDLPLSNPCEPQGPHGYYGLDAQVTQAIRAWMLGRDFPREIP
jgi:pimeloyl-ACP methyl ester carboxylesterase